MNNQQYIYTPFTEAEEVRQKDFGQILSKYLYHWPLFAACLLITVLLAVFYIKNTNPIYHVKAKISIQDDKNKNANPKETALMQLNLSTGSKLVESEVEVIKSRPLIRTVVDKLQLWTTYSQDNAYNDQDLYNVTPIRFKMLTSTGLIEDITFKIRINSMTQVTLTRPDGKEIDASISSRFKSGFGTWKLQPSSNYKDYIGKTINITLRNPEKVVTDYQGKITTVLNTKAPILELNIEDEVPKRGIQVLNNLIATYKGFNIIDKNKETESTLKFIDERLASLTGELTDVEKDVEGYKSSIGLTDISSKSQFFLDNVQLNDSRLNEVNIQLNVIQGVESYVNSPGNAEVAPATIGITDPGLISLVDQLSKLQLQKDKLLAITPENNPIFVPLDKQIYSVRKAIQENVRSVKTSLVNTKRQLTSFNSKFEEGIKNIPGQERQYISIKRQQGIKESLYVYLLQKREEVGLSYASTLTDARTVEQAYHGEPESRNKIPLILALLSGLLIPAGIVTGRTSLRNRVMTRKDIESATSAPVICELVQEENKKPIVVLNREAFAIGEQIRALRTSISHSYADKTEGKVILFSSSIASEGKSFVASNIATSMAAIGKKTIILELDLRKPKISKIFNLKASDEGISNYLRGEVTKEEVIVPSGIHPNLFVMGSGPVPDNPSELLESKRMDELIEDLKAEYDNIIIDSPPLHLVTDAMILAPLCDVTLYMVRHDVTPKSELKFIDEVFRSNKLKNMNLVFNGIQMDSRFGYSLDYGYYSDKPVNRGWNFIFGNFFARF